MFKKSISFFNIFAILLTISALQLISTKAFAQDVTGTWTGSSLAGGNTYPNTFTLQQQGSTVTGSELANNQPCTIAGAITGSSLSFHTICPTLNYSSDSTATTDGTDMSGTFLDSQGTTGTFTAHKTSSPVPDLTPNTKLTEAPIVQVKAQTAIFTLKKFSKISLSKLRKISLRAKAPKLTLQYELSITGAEKRKLTSKKNVISAKNLKPGNYSSKYKVTAYKDGVKAYSTKASPVAKFTIAPK